MTFYLNPKPAGPTLGWVAFSLGVAILGTLAIMINGVMSI